MIHVLYSSILYEGTKVLSYESTKVSYCTKVLSYESNLPSKVQYNYFRTLLVRKYFRISGSTEEYTTYFHYVRLLPSSTFVRKYESTTTRTRTCTCTRSYFYGFVHQHSLILYNYNVVGLHVRARVHSYLRTYVRIELINIISCTYILYIQ
jgi:hypothetical protein